MNAPASILHSTDGKTFKVGPFTIGQVMAMVAPGRFEGISPSAPGAHHLTHENGGTDQISVAGLTGLLATPQTPAAHMHIEADVTGLVADLTARELIANKGVASGYASLDATGTVPLTQLPDQYAPGSFTIPTGRFHIMTKRLQLTGTQRLTIQGTGRLRIT